MIAPLILLYMLMAARTRLCISQDPRSVLTLGALFLDPRLCVFAVVWCMVHIAALEAVPVAAIALDLLENT